VTFSHQKSLGSNGIIKVLYWPWYFCVYNTGPRQKNFSHTQKVALVISTWPWTSQIPRGN